jgi:hemerythrin-like domain-containing protein
MLPVLLPVIIPTGSFISMVLILSAILPTGFIMPKRRILFSALVTNGMPRENSPVAAMLMEHDQGRAYVLAMESAVQKTLDGLSGQECVIAENALAYAALLREHIAKEDDILYPLAERVIPEAMRAEIVNGYHRAETQADSGFITHYTKLIETYELQ